MTQARTPGLFVIGTNTGVGKTYLIKTIAQLIGVPFVKADATKFSETGYVGGDVEDLVRDLVHEADDDIELAQYGIIYIDEIDKIASRQGTHGQDIVEFPEARGAAAHWLEAALEGGIDPPKCLAAGRRVVGRGGYDKDVIARQLVHQVGHAGDIV